MGRGSQELFVGGARELKGQIFFCLFFLGGGGPIRYMVLRKINNLSAKKVQNFPLLCFFRGGGKCTNFSLYLFFWGGGMAPHLPLSSSAPGSRDVKI